MLLRRARQQHAGMHNLKDAKIFVESLNEDQRRALAQGLLLYGRFSSTALATRLCEVLMLAKAVHHLTQWRGE